MKSTSGEKLSAGGILSLGVLGLLTVFGPYALIEWGLIESTDTLSMLLMAGFSVFTMACLLVSHPKRVAEDALAEPFPGSAKRICVVGCPGAGKSTLTKELAHQWGLPRLHLDQLWWQPGWQEPDRAEFRRTLDSALASDDWICDGNFADFLAERLPRTDLIIWLDYSTPLCLFRALKRVLSQHGQVRSDMAPGCPETFDWKFFLFILKFRREYRPRLIKHLKTYQGRLLRFKTPNDLSRFLNGPH